MGPNDKNRETKRLVFSAIPTWASQQHQLGPQSIWNVTFWIGKDWQGERKSGERQWKWRYSNLIIACARVIRTRGWTMFVAHFLIHTNAMEWCDCIWIFTIMRLCHPYEHYVAEILFAISGGCKRYRFNGTSLRKPIHAHIITIHHNVKIYIGHFTIDSFRHVIKYKLASTHTHIFF